MVVEAVLYKKAADLLFSAISSLLNKNRIMAAEKESGILITEAIRELLSVNPNLNRVRSKLKLAEKKWPSPTEDLLMAQEMLERVSKSSTRKVSTSSRSKTRKKTRKKMPGKKVAGKKSKKK